MMICFPNAKINLGLNILRKRRDGFHDIESFLYPAPLCDVLELKESDSFKLITYGYDLAIPETENLVYKTWHLFNRQFSIPPLEIHLIKNIPVGSGLGGGSSDAAFLIMTINRYFKLKLDDLTLQKLAVQLGSDCPFFIKNEPAFAFGKGELLESSDLFLKGFWLVLSFPEISLSTAEAFQLIQPSYTEISLKIILSLPIEDWKDHLMNAFEKPVFKRHPELKEIKEKLYSMGAIYASLTGSGSCVYGIFQSKPDKLTGFLDCDSKWLKIR